MKQSFFRACIVALAMFACAFAQAALPELVVNTTGTVVYGTHPALIIKKDTSSGNRVMVRYPSGWQYVADDAAWTKYGKLVAGMGARGLAVDNDPLGTVYAVADSNGIYCQGNQTLISLNGIPLAESIPDACGFWAKAKANAN